MNNSRGGQSTVLTDHPAGLLDHIPGAVAVQGKTPSSLVGLWESLTARKSPQTMEFPPLLKEIPGGPAAVLHTGRASASQYLAVRNHLAGGGPLAQPVICLADSGDGFTGQSGRAWRAELGNLHLTLAVPCDLAAGPEAVALTALPAVAVHRTLAALLPDPDRAGPGIKWVNDILLNGGKVAGVLTSVRSQGGRLTSVVLGLGINVAVAPDLEPSVFTPSAVSLASAWPGGTPPLSAVFSTLVSELERGFLSLVHEGPDTILASYRERSLVLGRRVGVWPAGTRENPAGDMAMPERTGVVTRIRSDLSLELEGQSAPITSGRLAFLDGLRP